MKRSWIAAVVFSLISVVQSNVYAKDLPDFTVLAETQGPAVVNISITQNMKAENAMPFPGMPGDEQMQEFFRRFGIPMPGQVPGQNGAPMPEYKSQSLGSG